MYRILYVNTEGRMAGAEKSLLLLATHLEPYFEIGMAFPQHGLLASKTHSLRIKHHRLPQLNARLLSLSGLFSWLRCNYTVFKAILANKADIIHANNLFALTVTVLPVSLSFKKLVWHARDFSKHKNLMRICASFCEKIIAVSESIKRHLISAGINPNKIRVVHNGIDKTSFCSIEKTKSQIKYRRQEITFANIGQFVPWKKQEVFLQAAALVSNTIPDARFVIIGDDIFGRQAVYKQQLLMMVQETGIADKINIVAWQEAMSSCWHNIDCLVHTATKEPFGRVIIEAMANKIPVIAANSCGPKEIICNGESGILVAEDNPEEFGKAMTRIASDEKLAERLAEKGYETVMKKFTATQTANQIKTIYEEILGM